MSKSKTVQATDEAQPLADSREAFEKDVAEFAAQLEAFDQEKQSFEREQKALRDELKAVEKLKRNILAEKAAMQRGDSPAEVKDLGPKPDFLRNVKNGRIFSYTDALAKKAGMEPATKEDLAKN